MTITPDSYCKILQHLTKAIKVYRRWKWSEGTEILMGGLDLTPYRSDLAQYDFHLFGPMMNDLSTQHFRSDNKLKLAVLDWLEDIGGNFYFTAIL